MIKNLTCSKCNNTSFEIKHYNTFTVYECTKCNYSMSKDITDYFDYTDQEVYRDLVKDFINNKDITDYVYSIIISLNEKILGEQLTKEN